MTYDINSSEEREYLEDYNIEQFERPSVATDIVAFAVMQDGEQSNIRKLENRELKLLLRTKVLGHSPEVFYDQVKPSRKLQSVNSLRKQA